MNSDFDFDNKTKKSEMNKLKTWMKVGLIEPSLEKDAL